MTNSHQRPYRVYLSGPMSGVAQFNFGMFDRVEQHCETVEYWMVVSPARHDREMCPEIESWPGFATGDVAACPGFDLHAAMRWDLQQVALADGIVMLPGWESSMGAAHERYVAIVCGRDVWHVVDDIDGDIRLERECDPALFPLDDDPRGIVHVSRLAEDRPTHREVQVTDATTGGKKGSKPAQLGALDPNALLDLATVAGFGAEKYELFNYTKGYAWSLSYNALQRHLLAFWSGEDADMESGLPHLAHAAWHCLAMLTFLRFQRGTDDRFPLR